MQFKLVYKWRTKTSHAFCLLCYISSISVCYFFFLFWQLPRIVVVKIYTFQLQLFLWGVNFNAARLLTTHRVRYWMTVTTSTVWDLNFGQFVFSVALSCCFGCFFLLYIVFVSIECICCGFDCMSNSMMLNNENTMVQPPIWLIFVIKLQIVDVGDVCVICWDSVQKFISNNLPERETEKNMSRHINQWAFVSTKCAIFGAIARSYSIKKDRQRKCNMECDQNSQQSTVNNIFV